MSLPQGNEIAGQGGLLTLKAVKRTDAGIYGCRATDFDNLDADLSGEITMVVSCEWQGSYGHVYTHRQTGHIYTHRPTGHVYMYRQTCHVYMYRQTGHVYRQVTSTSTDRQITSTSTDRQVTSTCTDRSHV